MLCLAKLLIFQDFESLNINLTSVCVFNMVLSVTFTFQIIIGAQSGAEKWHRGYQNHLANLPAVVEEMLHRCKLLAALPASGLILGPDFTNV